MKLDFPLLESLFNGWLVGEVLDMLCTTFQDQNTMVLVEEMWMKIADLYDMADIYYDDADDLKVSFCGGPPDCIGMRHGTIKHLLMDRFMLAYYRHENKKVSAVLHRTQNEKSRLRLA